MTHAEFVMVMRTKENSSRRGGTELHAAAHLQRNLNGLADRRNTVVVQGEEEPVSRDGNTGIIGHGEGILGARGSRGRESDTSLIRVDCVGSAGLTDKGEALDGPAGGSGEGGANFEGIGADAADGWSSGQSTRGGVEVWRCEDLGIVVVGRAISAQTRASVDDSSIGQEEGNGVVVAGNGGRRKLLEGVGGRVEQLRNILRGIVTEGVGVGLTAHDEHGAVRQNDAVGECSRVSHVVDLLSACLRAWVANRDDLSIRSGIRVLIARRTANNKDLAVDSVIHSSVTAHGVSI